LSAGLAQEKAQVVLEHVGVGLEHPQNGFALEWHVRHVIEKLGVHSKLQAVIAAARVGLIAI